MEQQKELFLKALNACYGIVLTACESIGINRSTYYRWIKTDAAFKARVDDISESQLDFVEGKLMSSIAAGDLTAIIFYLKTKGKKRGYSEKPLPPQLATPAEPTAALPQKAVDEAEVKRQEQRVKAKKAYITKLLKEQGKYTPDLTYQVELTARLMVEAEELEKEMRKDGKRYAQVEYSREGNERLVIDPRVKLRYSLSERIQGALRALGMNNDAKDRPAPNADGFDDFLNSMSYDGAGKD